MFNAFQEFFENPAFRADGLKIYPTLVIRGTGMFSISLELCFFIDIRMNYWYMEVISNLFSGLYELWKTGRYKSYPPSGLIDLIARILALVPPWTRVYRVQRSVHKVKVFSTFEANSLD